MEILNARTERPLEGGRTFTTAFLVKRTLWDLTWLLLASWTPPPMFAWRRFLLRMFGAKVASTARIYGTTHIWDPTNLDVAAYVQIGPYATLYTMAPIKLEKYVIVSQGAHLCAGSHDVESPDFQTIAKPILLRERAWVAAEAFVGPGVTVGEGAVLGARSVAFRDLQAWTVYVGNPAAAIKQRRIRFDH